MKWKKNGCNEKKLSEKLENENNKSKKKKEKIKIKQNRKQS